MKYIKTFENKNYNLKFKIDDYVIALDKEYLPLKGKVMVDASGYMHTVRIDDDDDDEEYEKEEDEDEMIFKIFKINKSRHIYYAKNDYTEAIFSENEIRLASSGEIEDYMARKYAKKYNL